MRSCAVLSGPVPRTLILTRGGMDISELREKPAAASPQHTGCSSRIRTSWTGWTARSIGSAYRSRSWKQIRTMRARNTGVSRR